MQGNPNTGSQKFFFLKRKAVRFIFVLIFLIFIGVMIVELTLYKKIAETGKNLIERPSVYDVGETLAQQNALGNKMPTVTAEVPLTAVPAVFYPMLDFSQVHTYDMKKTNYSNSVVVYELKFDTGHLAQNFANLRRSMVIDNKYILEYSDLETDSFKLVFKKDKIDMRAEGGPNSGTNPAEPSTISIILQTHP